MPVILYQVWAFVVARPDRLPSGGRSGRGSRSRSFSSPLGVAIAYVILPFAVRLPDRLLDRGPAAAHHREPLLRLRDDACSSRSAWSWSSRSCCTACRGSDIVTSERLRPRAGGRRSSAIAIFAAAITPGQRPRQPDRAGRDDVRAVRRHDLRHPAQREVGDPWARWTMTADEGSARTRQRPGPCRRRATQEVVVVTGLSGGGKTAAAKLFEDLGYVVVDNLPGELLPGPRGPDRERPAAVRAHGDRARRPRRRRAARVRRDARRAGGSRDPPGDHLPRGARRRADPAVQRDPPPPPARGRARHRGLDRARARAARLRPRRRPTSCSTRATSRCASSASESSPASATSSARTACDSSSSASATSTACRSRPTSCSTSGS